MIRAVLFDVGGPLDTEVAREAAIDADIRAGLGREGIVVSDEAWVEAQTWAVASFAPNLYRAVIWRLSGHDRALCGRVESWMASRSALRESFELREGITDVLAKLKAHGLKLGLAANQPTRVLSLLDQHGIGHYFENQGIAGVYGLLKPDVRLFLRSCEDLGVNPLECIMVGDRIDNDTVPAKLLGMRTVHLVTGRHREQRPRAWNETPDYEVEDAAGILKAIESILAQDGGG